MSYREFYMVGSELPIVAQTSNKFTTEEQSEVGWKYGKELLEHIANIPNIHDEIIIKKENKDEC